MPIHIVVLSASKHTLSSYHANPGYNTIPGHHWVRNFVNSASNVINSDKSVIYAPTYECYGLRYIDDDDNEITPLEKVESIYKHPAENKTVFFYEIYKDGLEENVNVTANAAVVIYYINVLANETFDKFASRAAKEIALLQSYDLSDHHVTKHLVINRSANTDPSFIEGNETIRKLSEFTVAHRFEKDCYTINVCDAEKGEVGQYLDALIKNTSAPNILSRFLGSLFYVLLGGLTLFILVNPLNLYFTHWSMSRWNTPANIVFSCLHILLSPLIYLYAFTTALINQAAYGWNRGLLVGLESPFYAVKNNFFYKKSIFKLRNLIASLVIIGLTTGAVLLTLGLLGPAVVGGIGLTALAIKGATLAAGFIGVNSGNIALAVIAGTAVAVAGSILYGIGYGAYLGIKTGFNFIRSCFQSSTKYSLLHATDGEADSRDQFPLTYIPTKPTQSVAPAAQGAAVSASVAGRQIPIVTTAPGAQQYQDPYAASYRQVITPAAAAAAALPSTANSATDPESLKKLPPPNARLVPYKEFPIRPENPLSLRDVPLSYSTHPDPLPPGLGFK